MRSNIEASDLVAAVEAYLREIELQLEGRQAFHAKVAANALGIVLRELDEEPRKAEADALAAIGSDVAVACARIRSGEWSTATPGLLDALETGIAARLAVDNPKFSTLKRIRERR